MWQAVGNSGMTVDDKEDGNERGIVYVNTKDGMYRNWKIIMEKIWRARRMIRVWGECRGC